MARKQTVNIAKDQLAYALSTYSTIKDVAAHFGCSEGTILIRRRELGIGEAARLVRSKGNDTITCKVCKQEKDTANDFYYNKKGARKSTTCKACVIAETVRRNALKEPTERERQQRSKATANYRRRQEFTQQVGLSIDEYPAIFALWCEVKDHQAHYHIQKHSITCPDAQKAAKQWNDTVFNFFKNIREKQNGKTPPTAQ